MSRSMIYLVFTDPFYYGEFEYPKGSGIWHEGKHEKMITREEFERVQVLLGNKGRPRPKTHEFTYTGLLRCGECSAMITAEEKYQIICTRCKYKFSSLNKADCPHCQTLIMDMDNPTRLHYTYYHCTKRKKKTCSQKAIRVEKFEQQFDTLLEKIQISEDFKNWAIKHLNEYADNEIEDRNSIINSQKAAYDNCVNRIDNLIKFKISPQNSNGELLSDDEFRGQKEALLKEKAGLLEGLNSTDGRIDKWIELTEKTFNFACYARYWFSNGDKETRKQVLLGIGSNLTLKDGIVAVDLQKPLQFIETAKNEVVEISEMFEPTKEVDKSSQMDSFYSKNLTLLPR
jgi:site-specific DNA recombinase